MKKENYIPDIIDFAYQIIDMHKKIIFLEQELENKNRTIEIYQEGAESSEKHGKEMLGMMVNAILDPDSSINSGSRAVAEIEMSKREETK